MSSQTSYSNFTHHNSTIITITDVKVEYEVSLLRIPLIQRVKMLNDPNSHKMQNTHLIHSKFHTFYYFY